MVIGSYYLTMVKPGEIGEGKVFSSYDEAIMAYQAKEIKLQTLCYIRFKKQREDGTVESKILHTTLGRCIFDKALPQDIRLGGIDRSKADNFIGLEIEGLLGKACRTDSAVRNFRGIQGCDGQRRTHR